MENISWLPIAEYAIRHEVSVSTLRRKIKTNKIDYKMDNGRYLLRSVDEGNGPKKTNVAEESIFTEEAAPELEPIQNDVFMRASDDQITRAETKPVFDVASANSQMDELRWKALEARVAGLSKKVEFLIEQNSELKMLVKIFEERLNADI